MKVTAIMCLIAMAILTTVSGCSREKQGVVGFVLPTGDLQAGKDTFVRLGCRGCHHVAGTDLTGKSQAMPFEITLGGPVSRVRSYGDLMNAIVSPNHELAPQYVAKMAKERQPTGKSPMPDFTGTMTVAELIDLVTFLHKQYELSVPEYRGAVYGP